MKRTKFPKEAWVLLGGSFMIALGYGIVAPVMPLLANSFGVSFAVAGLVVSVFAAMRFVAGPLASFFTTRFGGLPGLLVGLSIVTVTTIFCAYAASMTELLVWRALGGIGSVTFSVASSVMLFGLAPATARAQIVSLNAAAFLSGNIIGPLLGALLVPFGMRAPFIVYGVILALTAALIAVLLRNSRVGRKPDSRAAKNSAMTLGEGLRFQSFRGSLIGGFSNGIVWGMRMAILPLFIASYISKDPAAAGWAMAAYAAGNALLVVPAGRLNDRLGRRPLIIIGTLVSAVALLLLPFSTEIILMIIVVAIIGMAGALANPGINATVADVAGKRGSAKLIASLSMVTDLGVVIGPVAVGALLDGVSPLAAFWACALMMLITCTVWVFSPEPLRLHTKQSSEVLPTVSPDIAPATGAISIVELPETTGSIPIAGFDPQEKSEED
ncbi:MFS transporter [Canibacter zhoujuaniae]|uniref:MFS transporter n=1 Tax=Canibacter zhoujuaniae TaxID=2708343 RepID=UPI0014237A19|nr:MFS transporter [Canibacter zhoujuaniae]